MSLVTEQRASEIRPHEFVTEASDICLAPGNWPTILTTSLGNGHNFVLTRFERREGEIISAHYQQVYGCVRLTVFND